MPYTLDELYDTPASSSEGALPAASFASEAGLRQLVKMPTNAKAGGTMGPTLEEEIKNAKTPEIRKILEQELGRRQVAKPRVFSLDELYGPRSDASIAVGGAVEATKAVARSITDFGDMILSVPGMVMGSAADIASRTQSLLEGQSHPAAGRIAKTVREGVTQQFSPPIFRNLLEKAISAFAPDEEAPDASAVQTGMTVIAGGIEHGGKWVEKKTGGVITGEDFDSLVNLGMAAGGLKGAAAGAKALTPKEAAPNIKPIPEPQPSIPPNLKAAIEDTTGVTSTRAAVAAAKARREQARAAFREDAEMGDYYRQSADQADYARQLEAVNRARGVEAEALDKASPSRIGTAEPVILNAEGKIDTTAIGQRPLDTAMQKITDNQAFMMSAEEVLAMRKNASEWGKKDVEQNFNRQGGAVDQTLLNILAVGGTAAALAYAYPEEASDFAKATMAAGVLLTGDAKRMAAKPDGSSLGVMLGESASTLKTLERLPQNRAEFQKQMLEEQLRRPDVSKAEKEVLGAVLAVHEGPTITAKELVLGFKREVGSFELEKKTTDQYANYGLESINRFGTGDALLAAVEDTPVGNPTTTTLYRLPEHMEMSNANHFFDPRLFGWTRSFEEGGVRHVVEIQSDLVQHAKGAVSAERAAELTKEAADLTQEHSKLLEENSKVNIGSPGATARSIRMREINLRKHEIRVQLEASAVSTQLSPMLKDWWKRLVREELAGAARIKADAENAANTNRQLDADFYAPDIQHYNEIAKKASTVRFATPDTVAKVEGWPNPRSAAKEELTTRQEQLRNMRSVIADMEARGEEVPQKNLTTLPIIERYILEAQRRLETAPELSPEHQSIYNRYRDIEKFQRSLGGQPFTDAAGHTWIDVPTQPGAAGRRAAMFGGADQGLLKGAGLLAAGAVVGQYIAENKKEGALVGAALAGLAMFAHSKSSSVRNWADSIKTGAEHGLGVLSTTITGISKPTLHRLRAFEMNVLVRGHEQLVAAHPFIEGISKLKGEAAKSLERAILTNDPAKIRAQMTPELWAEYGKVRGILSGLEGELRSAGLLEKGREDYFPRVVTDSKGLLATLGKEERTTLQAALAKAEKDSFRLTGVGLSPLETSQVINKHLRMPQKNGQGSGFLRQRTLDEVTEATQPFYAPPKEALPIYIRSATKAIEKAKFFGRDLVKVEKDGRSYVDLDSSIGNAVRRELEGGKITFEQAETLSQALTSRFGPGERPMSPAWQTYRNVTNAILLGNPLSAAVQFGDIAVSVGAHGLLPTLGSVVQKLTGRAQIGGKELGLVEHISEEFTSTQKSAKFLNFMFKYSGFSFSDLFGKDVAIGASLRKFESWAQTPAGVERIKAKYQDFFGVDMPALLEELRTKKPGPQISALLFHEISNLQPITKLEVPKTYLDSPNGRVLYTLKTFMIKQADILRREAYQEIKAGNIVKGVSSLLRYSIALGVSGASTSFLVNWLRGRDDKLEWGDIPENALKTFGWSSYVLDKAKKGKPVEAVLGTVTPPFKIFDDIVRGDPKAVTYIPIVGKTIYDFGLGGADDYNLKKAARDKRTAKESEMTDAEKELRRQEKIRRRLRRLEKLQQEQSQ